MAFDAATFEVDPRTLTTPRARLEYLRDFLRRLPPERFYMGDYVTEYAGDVRRSAHSTAELHRCGTAACIAGWATHIFSPVAIDPRVLPEWSDWGQAHDYAAAALGLTQTQAHSLFAPLEFAGSWSRINSRHAAAAIDYFLNTGAVDWSVALETI